MSFIAIGSVPSEETPVLGAIKEANQAGIFLKQLQRMRPLLPESHARYTVSQRKPGSVPWIEVAIVVEGKTWSDADLVHDLAKAAQEITHWDDEALAELDKLGIAPRKPLSIPQFVQAA